MHALRHKQTPTRRFMASDVYNTAGACIWSVGYYDVGGRHSCAIDKLLTSEGYQNRLNLPGNADWLLYVLTRISHLQKSWAASCSTLASSTQRTMIVINRFRASHSVHVQQIEVLLTSQTEWAINKMSSAYNTIYTPFIQENILAISSKYRAKRNGERTEPCLTP